MSMQSLTTTYQDDLANTIRSGNSFLNNNPAYTKIGLGIERVSGCTIRIYVVYAN